jgi:phosphodiesterase/alkaline phosphatase D-like protein
VPELILGPLLRHISERDATVWVETDSSCEVEVLGHQARTFHVAGHHYALVAIEGLEPGESTHYTVALNGQQRWPDPGSSFPPSRIRTLDPARGFSVAFGSCRVAAPHERPYVLERDEHRLGRGVDALQALALRLCHTRSEQWPSLLLMLGDQVYADHASPQTRAFIRSRRNVREPPGEEVADFEEYTRLYRESWSEPLIRWLFSTVPSAMIFDDHEVIDDWNTSEAWKAEMSQKRWWPERIAGALMSYWIYQHLGNLAPRELREDRLYTRALTVADAEPMLREFALRSARTTAGSRWSYSRELGRSRLVVIDSRAGRVLRDSRREMLDEDEWRWLDGQLRGDVDHLLVATSLPFLLPQPIHDLEEWAEAVSAGAWGPWGMKLGERLRRAIDLEHWAAFRSSFDRLARILREVASGERGVAPASILVLSGDVHYAYLAESSFPGQPVRSRVFQVVCSPFRHSLDPPLQKANRLGFTRTAERIGALLARSADLPARPISWRMTHGPFFENEVATVDVHAREATLKFERTPPRELRLECVLQAALT